MLLCRLLPVAALLAALKSTPVATAGTIRDHNTWGSVSLTGPLRPAGPWRYWFDTQNKLADDSRRLAQATWRTGLGYALSTEWSVWAGYSYAETDQPYAGSPYHEHRLFEQVQWNHRAGDFTLGTRQRLEQRFLQTGDDMGLRSRHQFRVSHPLPGPSPLYWLAWDEVFLNLNRTNYGARTGLDQNRLFVGLGCGLGESSRLEAGYLHNFNRRPGRDDRLNQVLALSLAFAFK